MSNFKAHWIDWLNREILQKPIHLAASIFIGFFLIRFTFDILVLLTAGFRTGSQPLWESDVWWPELVNAALIAYIPAVLLIARNGIDRDLNQLRPRLPGGSVDVKNILSPTTGLRQFIERAMLLVVIALVIMYVYLEPSMSDGAEPSLTNPPFVWAIIRNVIFAWLVFELINSDFSATIRYFHLGRNLIKVDLLDIESLSPFARRGLRSALTWVIFLMIFSLYWLDEDVASPINFYLMIMALTVATTSFVLPLIGAHRNILSVKQLELESVRKEIRMERASAIEKYSGDVYSSPRLANLIGYYQLISRTREWPIDAANLLRFFMYILIGLGSWLGGALVERLLDITLAG